MLGWMSAGHTFMGGGDAPKATKVKGGLLGWIGALSSGGLILCFVIIALMQFLSFFRLFR